MQNPHSVWRKLLALLNMGVAAAGLAILVVSGMMPARFTVAHGLEQGTNLLQNGGFEGTYAPFQGDNTRLVAPGWTPWAVPHQTSDPGFVNLQPEYRAAANPRRVRSGSSAQEWFTFFATHTGGVLQRVPASPGQVLQFSVWVNVWSTSLDDVNASEQPGRVRIRAGIDPFGGTDGTSPNIVWNTAPELYDQYQNVTVTTAAASPFVTVFVESSPKDPVKNNNIYVDDAALTPTGQVAATNTLAPTNTALPTTAVAEQPTDTPSSFEPTREGTIIPSGPTETPGGVIITAPTITPGGPATNTPVPLATSAPGGGNAPGRVLYTVVAGDTLSGIAARYGTTVDAITAANELNADGLIFVGQQLVVPVPATPTPVPPSAVPSAGGGGSNAPVDTANLTGPTVNGIGTYIVQPGDDFVHIAQHYGLSVAALAQLNGIVNPNAIALGTVLVVPGPGNNVPGGSVPPTVLPTNVAPAPARTHTVAAGENLFRIALKYNVPLDSLMRANGIINPNLVYVGQVLRIP